MDEGGRILVVDDFATMRKVVRNILRQIGYSDITEAENGEAALRLATRGEFDLVISDWNMPVMSGLEFVKALRKNEHTHSLPVLMVTAEALKENVIEALSAGANNYIVKPFTPTVLKEKVEAIFSAVRKDGDASRSNGSRGVPSPSFS